MVKQMTHSRLEPLGRIARLGGWILLAALVAACSGDDRTMVPTAPTAAPAPVPTAAPVSSVAFIRAVIQDSAFRLLAGARVEVLDGASAGTTGVADGNGVVTLNGTFSSETHFRATHNGHESVTQRWSCSVPVCGGNAQPWLNFQLRPDSAAIDLAGEYTLTITAGASCGEIPNESRSRSHQATLSPRVRPGTADVLGYEVRLSSSTLPEFTRQFIVGVAGDFVRFGLASGHGDEPGLVERIGENRYVTYLGVGAATATTRPASFTLPFDGVVSDVTLPTPLTSTAIGSIVSQSSCTASDHRFAFARR